MPEEFPENQIFPSIGEEGFTRLVAAFYRHVPGDVVLGPLYPADDLVGAEVRLRDFLIQRFGGPTRYSDARGHPRLRMRHGPFKVDATAAQHWLRIMDLSLKEVGFDDSISDTLRRYFRQTAIFMINHTD